MPTPNTDSPRVFFFEGNRDGTVGGSYFSLFFLAEGIDRARYTPVVGFRREIPFVSRFREAGLEVHIVPGHRVFRPAWLESTFVKRIPGLRPLWLLAFAGANWISFVVSGPQWASFLRRHRIQLVHANNSVTRCHDLMFGALIAGVPAITHERGINSHFSRVARFFARRLHAIICISEAVRTNLAEHGVGNGQYSVVFNAVDPSRVRPSRSAAEVRRAHNIGPDQRVLAMVGNIRRWKGQHVVVDAMATIVKAFPDTVCLFVGDATEQDRPFERELHDTIARLGLHDHVKFVGYQSNVADFINAADATIHASVLPEPFGRVLVEAMALRKPVIGSRGGAVPEIVVDGVTGRTFEPGNAADLAACAIDVLRDLNRTRAMGDAGFERLVRFFSIHENLSKTQAVYDTLLKPEWHSATLTAP